jgi:hypothetical protein
MYGLFITVLINHVTNRAIIFGIGALIGVPI